MSGWRPAGPIALAASQTTPVVFVRSLSDLPAPVGGVITLPDEAVHCIVGTVDLGANRIVIPNGANAGSTLCGVNQAASILIGDVAAPLVTMEGLYSFVSDLTIRNDSASGSDLRIDQAGSVTLVERVRFRGAGTQVELVTGANALFEKCSTSGATTGVSITGAWASVVFTDSAFIASGASQTGINVGAAATLSRRLRLSDCIAITGATSTGIAVADRAASFATSGFVMSAVDFAGAGTNVSGATATDNECLWQGMQGEQSTSVGGEMYMYGNATATTVSASGTWYKAAGTTTAGATLDRFTHTANRLTYTGEAPSSVQIAGVASVSSGNNNDVRIAIAKNGTVIDAESSTTTSAGGSVSAVPVVGKVDVANGDYLEVWVRNDSAATNITLTDVYVSAQGTI